MKFVLVLFLSVIGLGALAGPVPDPRAPAPSCDESKCVLPNCRCSSTTAPGGFSKAETPQFVLLTFDDAVNILNIKYYKEHLYNRVNPNKCPISMTLFDSHENTDYSLIHDLHANGMEISLHSITHQSNTTYWKTADVALLNKEFAEQRDLISKFANIPKADLKGIRMPFLQMAGNNQFEMLNKNGFLYDLSWSTQSYVQPGMWPYTTEYLSNQDCLIGPCPDQSYPNVWVIPMLTWKGNDGAICSMGDACIFDDDVTKITNWMIGEFNKQYNGNRAPFGVYIHAAWFDKYEHSLEAYVKFLDYLKTLPDVYITAASKVIDWIKKPMKVADMAKSNATCTTRYTPKCTPKFCSYKDGQMERVLTHCLSECTKSYPWLGNPLGDK